MFQILLKSAQELKRTDIFLFKNTNAAQSAPKRPKAPQSAPAFHLENLT